MRKTQIGLLAVVVLVVAGGASLWFLRLLRDYAAIPSDVAPSPVLSYRNLRQMVDTERRTRPLGPPEEDERLDITAFAGMPHDYADAASEYITAVVRELSATPITRKRYFYDEPHKPGQGSQELFPDKAIPKFDRDVIVPITLLPRPEAAARWAATERAREQGWRTAADVAACRGPVYGRTLIFQPGPRSQDPIVCPPVPFKTLIPSADLYNADMIDGFYLHLGKVVLEPRHDVFDGWVEIEAPLRLGEPQGAKLLGELVTVPVSLENVRLRWASLTKPTGARQFLAYSLLDGSGARRRYPILLARVDPVSPYVRPLRCERHQPRIKQHDELLLPTPLAWPEISNSQASDEDRRFVIRQHAHEEWCLDDWFPAQPEACWVVREAEDSQPLKESFLLMPAQEPSDRPVFLIALFAETEPKQLLAELAALYHLSADEALNSPDTLAHLEDLYRKVRDFPLGE